MSKQSQFEGKSVYISGKMRGVKDNNFPAFDKARDKALELGFEKVYSPADMDRLDDPAKICQMESCEVQKMYAVRDIDAIIKSTYIAMIPGWHINSLGARAEYFTALWLGKMVLDAETFEPLEYEVEIVIKKKELQNV